MTFSQSLVSRPTPPEPTLPPPLMREREREREREVVWRQKVGARETNLIIVYHYVWQQEQLLINLSGSC